MKILHLFAGRIAVINAGVICTIQTGCKISRNTVVVAIYIHFVGVSHLKHQKFTLCLEIVCIVS